jgi:hypothetical protein
MPLTTDNITSEGLLQTKSWRTEALVQATAAGTLTLTSTSALVTMLTGTTAGQIVQLPDATTISVGHRIEIHNNSSQSITVNEADATLSGVLTNNQRALYVLQEAGTVGGTWSTQVNEVISSQATVHNMFEEFFFQSLSDLDVFHFLNFGVNGGSATIETGAPTDNSYVGKVTCSTGGTVNNTGVGGFESSTGDNRIKCGGGDMAIEFRIRLPVLSGTPQYNVKLGVMDSNTLGTPTNGVYFNYSSTLNSGQWQAITRNASTSTTVPSSIAVVAATWYKLRLQVNAAGNLVTFYINDVSIGTSNANIPTTNACRIMFRIEKQGSNSGTSRTLEVDSVYYRMER